MYQNSYSYSNNTFTEISGGLSQEFQSADSSPTSNPVCYIQAFYTNGDNPYEVYDRSGIVNVSIKRSGCNGSFTIGSVSAAQVNLETLTSIADELVDCDYFYVYMGYEGLTGTDTQLIRFGRFFIDKKETERKQLFTSLKAYDAFAQPQIDEVVYLYAVPSDDTLQQYAPDGQYLLYQTTNGVLDYETRQSGKVYTGYRFRGINTAGNDTVMYSYIADKMPSLGITGRTRRNARTSNNYAFDNINVIPSDEYANKVSNEGVSEPVRNTVRDLLSRSSIENFTNMLIDNDKITAYYSARDSMGTISRSCIKAGSIELSPLHSEINGVVVVQEQYAAQGSTFPTKLEYQIPNTSGMMVELSLDSNIYDIRNIGYSQADFDQNVNQYVTYAIGRTSQPNPDPKTVKYRGFSLEAFNNMRYEPFDRITFDYEPNQSQETMILDATYTFNGSLMVEYSADNIEDASVVGTNSGSGTASLGGYSSTWALMASTTGTSAVSVDLAQFSEVLFYIEIPATTNTFSCVYNVRDLTQAWVNVGGWYMTSSNFGKGEIHMAKSGTTYTFYLSGAYVNGVNCITTSNLKIYVR